ncbi:hypothetical protein Glove_300g67 [Diversispora epigaea]|uniref:Uncharacterized protein n=1 Tax=Diversispora epigaea TaxID=1348612 RepID=A0A397HWJ4_9GLOM|nr:hypothetical protein Glove_300g67 [Diversispora epigaea]
MRAKVFSVSRQYKQRVPVASNVEDPGVVPFLNFNDGNFIEQILFNLWAKLRKANQNRKQVFIHNVHAEYNNFSTTFTAAFRFYRIFYIFRFVKQKNAKSLALFLGRFFLKIEISDQNY